MEQRRAPWPDPISVALFLRAAALALFVVVTAAAPDRAHAALEPFGKAYATLDVYADYASQGRTRSLRSGGMSPSYIGVSGGVRLLKGLTLTLLIEHNVDIVKASFLKNGIGNRRASVGVASDWGTLLFGRQFTPHLWFLGAEIDAFNLGFNGTPYMILSAGVAVMLRTKAVSYESPRLFGLSVQFMVANDAEPDMPSFVKSNDLFVKVDFKYEGLYLGGALVEQHDATWTRRRQIAAYGGSYTLGPLVVTAGVQRILERGANLRTTEYLAGVKLLGDNYQVLGSFGLTRADGQTGLGAMVHALAYAYSVTESITAYASIAWLDNYQRSQFNLGVPVETAHPSDDYMIGGRIRF